MARSSVDEAVNVHSPSELAWCHANTRQEGRVETLSTSKPAATTDFCNRHIRMREQFTGAAMRARWRCSSGVRPVASTTARRSVLRSTPYSAAKVAMPTSWCIAGSRRERPFALAMPGKRCGVLSRSCTQRTELYCRLSTPGIRMKAMHMLGRHIRCDGREARCSTNQATGFQGNRESSQPRIPNCPNINPVHRRRPRATPPLGPDRKRVPSRGQGVQESAQCGQTPHGPL